MRMLAVGFLLIAAAATAQAAESRLELGVGAVALHLPDYRGSDHSSVRALPVPYLVYRSERLRVTREGLRAWLFAGDRLSLSVSAAASLPGNADDNPLRTGMPELDPTFEIGPSLDLRLHESADGAFRTRLRLPVRAVLATDARHFDSAGWLVIPHIQASLWQDRDRWQIFHTGSLGPLWASEKYHEYFYGIRPQFMTPMRPAYDAHGGYSGTRLSLSSSVERGRVRFGLFVSYDWLRGAAYDDSPLFETEHSIVSGVFLTFRLYRSGVASPNPEGEAP